MSRHPAELLLLIRNSSNAFINVRLQCYFDQVNCNVRHGKAPPIQKLPLKKRLIITCNSSLWHTYPIIFFFVSSERFHWCYTDGKIHSKSKGNNNISIEYSISAIDLSVTRKNESENENKTKANKNQWNAICNFCDLSHSMGSNNNRINKKQSNCMLWSNKLDFFQKSFDSTFIWHTELHLHLHTIHVTEFENMCLSCVALFFIYLMPCPTALFNSHTDRQHYIECVCLALNRTFFEWIFFRCPSKLEFLRCSDYVFALLSSKQKKKNRSVPVAVLQFSYTLCCFFVHNVLVEWLFQLLH